MDAFNKSKLSGKHLVGLRVIEPINLAPGVYNSIDPTAADFFEPEHFYVLGRKIHKSRFLYFADNIPPQVLKPVYLFFGIPLAQLAFTYVQDFYKAKDVCTRILQKFSCSAISTDIEKLIYANGKNAVKDRISTIAKYRDNDSILVLDKENEEFSQTNTPLAGLKEMWYASLELIPMIFGIPATKLLEISPSGFNSTGEFEMRNFYDSVHTKQSNVFDAPLKRLLEVICYTKGFDPDILAWSWKSLFKMSDKETAEVNRMEADTAQIYYNMGVVGNDDIAKRLINDKDSGYNNIEIPERIDPFQVGEEGPEVPQDETEETEPEQEQEPEGTAEESSDIEKSDVKDEAPKSWFKKLFNIK
jgi:phage-related protein (TIGR01555 family)